MPRVDECLVDRRFDDLVDRLRRGDVGGVLTEAVLFPADAGLVLACILELCRAELDWLDRTERPRDTRFRGCLHLELGGCECAALQEGDHGGKRQYFLLRLHGLDSLLARYLML
jgi:hypothetical protein